MTRSSPGRRLLFLVGAALLIAGCIISRSIEVSPIDHARSDSARIESPVKAHLTSGATVVFRDGAEIMRDTVWGRGQLFTPGSSTGAAIARVPLDSVIAMESFAARVDPLRTVMYSTLASAATIGGAIAIACIADPKCFGSCPTFYSDSGDTLVLEAEGFSYSIAPLFEARDVDRLRAQPDPAGRLDLQVWNEALETHYINHLELLEMRHAPGEFVVPDDRGRPLAISGALDASSVRDRAGRSVAGELAARDGRLYATPLHVLQNATLTDLDDHIDVTLPRPAGVDSVALLLRMRNSLLNTELFYEYMLARPGARSIDYIASDLSRIDRVLELGRWYASRLGLRIAVRDDSGFREVVRLSDYGPIAWRDVAAVIPVPSGDSLRIRLAFVADQWRIDEMRLAPHVRRATPRIVPLAAVHGRDGTAEPHARDDLLAADDRYLQTTPPQRFTARFEAGPFYAVDSARTFFLASQGYYIEWVRGSWMKGPRDTATFSPGDETLLRAMRSWSAARDSMEQRFYRSRIPVL